MLTIVQFYICLQEQRIHALQVRIGDSEQALAALEKTASERMDGLTQQSSTALDRLQRQLGQAYSQLEQLHALIKVATLWDREANKGHDSTLNPR